MRSLIPLLSLTLLAPSALADDTPAAPAPTPPAPDSAKAPDAKGSDAEAPVVEPAPAPKPVPPTTFSALDRGALPDRCASHARFAHAAVKPIAAAARLSLAQCLIAPSLAPIKSVLDTGESMQTLERAVAQSLVLFDEVVALGDPTRQVLAAHAKGQLYEDLLGRMAQAVPPPTGGEAAAALYQSRKTVLDLMLQPWRDAATASFETAIAIAKAHPKVAAKHPTVRDVLARSEVRLQTAKAAEAAKAQPAPPTEASPPSKLPAGATAAPAETAPIAPPQDKPKDGASAPSGPPSGAPSSPVPR